MSSSPLHILFFPFMAQGHLLPMLDIANLFNRRGVRTTIITTPAIAPQVEQYITRSEIPMQQYNIPGDKTTVPRNPIALLLTLPRMHEPFAQALAELRPDCVITDMFLPWTLQYAAEFNIPRIVFRGTSYFYSCAMHALAQQNHDTDTDTVVLPGLPHRIEMLRTQLPLMEPTLLDVFEEISKAEAKSYGMVVNSFYELEPDYADYYRNVIGRKSWHVGPVANISAREIDSNHECLKWLDTKSPGSVIYICFGSLGEFTTTQLREIALGLQETKCPFIWVVRSDTDEWVPEGLEERGMIVRGWAPQILILNHEAVGGFVTHCGWNSCLEGICAGKVMVTWPMFADQFLNERLIVDVLRIGVAAGVERNAKRAEKRGIVGNEKIASVIGMVMGSGEEADERRRRAKELAAAAGKAVEKGGSSYDDMGKLIQELMEMKDN